MLNLKDHNLLKSKNYINGKWKKGGAGKFDVINPSTNNKVITCLLYTSDAADE